jgi:hypothetical protein
MALIFTYPVQRRATVPGRATGLPAVAGLQRKSTWIINQAVMGGRPGDGFRGRRINAVKHDQLIAKIFSQQCHLPLAVY